MEKLDASETDLRRLNAENGLENPKRWRICVSCGRWFSKNIRKRLRIPRTHSETGIHRKESESQRRISRRKGRVSTWRIRRWRRSSKDKWSIQGYIIHCHHIEPRVQFACRVKNHPLFHTIFNGRRLEKSQNIWGKQQIQLFLIKQGKDGNLYFYKLCARISFRWKILRKLFT